MFKVGEDYVFFFWILFSQGSVFERSFNTRK
jgi:hypothetical protein